MKKQTNSLNNLPKFQNPPQPPSPTVVARMYCQVEETWFSDINQIKNYIDYFYPNDKYLKDTLRTTIQKGYNISNNALWKFIYNPDKYDSVPLTVSIHKTKEGAEKAMQIHKEQIKAEFDNTYNNLNHQIKLVVEMKWDDDQYWDIQEIKIEE